MTRAENLGQGSRSKQAAFSLVEVMVTIVIVAIALLGTAALQAKAMRLNQGGMLRSQAVFLVADLAERMEANRGAAVNGAYALSSSDTMPQSTDCTAAACDASALARFDLLQWKDAVAANLPQSTWSVTQTTTGNPCVYEIRVSWVDRRENTNYANTGAGETFSYRTTRSVRK